ncbi:unnamed protein product [Amoebophrya sp. A25]|nr:unnamed protein product [Amoebophrya sp. A25]|eukprot:GSA25T00002848001.1
MLQSGAAQSPSMAFRFPRTGLVSRNRTVLAAMTNRQSFPDGTLSKEEIDFLVRRAEGGFGIVTTACAHVTRDGQGFPGELGVFEDKFIPNLRFLANELRRCGALSLAQIFHAGLQAPESLTGEQPKSPSGPLQVGEHLASSKYNFSSRELSNQEVWNLVEAFAAATQRVYDAGFDGVELHGAHGYLINQFLGPETNFRTDEFGGTREKRFRFLIEIIHAIRQRSQHWTRPFLIGVRISPERNCGVRLEDSLELARRLRDLEIDFLHVSCWDIRVESTLEEVSPQMNSSISRKSRNNGRTMTLTEHFTRGIDNLPPVITTGRIWTRDDCLLAMQTQGADLVGSARASIGNPDWAQNIVEEDAACLASKNAAGARAESAYKPLLPPYSEEHLKRQSLSDIFVYYMRRWRFVHREGKILPFRD